MSSIAIEYTINYTMKHPSYNFLNAIDFFSKFVITVGRGNLSVTFSKSFNFDLSQLSL